MDNDKKGNVVYKERSINYWATHMGLLFRALQVTKGTIVEMGTGGCSTPLLHALCAATVPQRKLVSLENDLKWLDLARPFENDYHSVRHVTSWSKWCEADLIKDIGVVLVDHGSPKCKSSDAYDERIRSVEFYADRAEIIVVHDTDFEYFYKNPMWPPVVQGFKYVVTDIINGSATTAFSNWLDVRKALQPRLEIFKNILYDRSLVVSGQERSV